MNKETIYTVVEEITPDIAKQYLATSNGNRAISKKTVSAYARDMANGRWALNGEPITFDMGGHLSNGHHRLMACIEANIPFKTSVTRGVQDSSVYDRLRPRSARDQFKINGEDDLLCDNLLIAVIRRHMWMKKKIYKVTDPEIREFYYRNRDTLTMAISLVRTGHSTIRKAPVAYALFCALVVGVPTRTLKRFCEVCAYGTIETPDEIAALKMREFIYKHWHWTREEQLVLQYAVENAIRDFADGRIRKKSYTTAEKPVYSNQRIVELL